MELNYDTQKKFTLSRKKERKSAYVSHTHNGEFPINYLNEMALQCNLMRVNYDKNSLISALFKLNFKKELPTLIRQFKFIGKSLSQLSFKIETVAVSDKLLYE